MTEKSYEALTSAIGACIAAWNGVEDELSNLFMLLHSKKPWNYSDPLRAAYEAVVSLDVKMQMIVATASADPVTSPVYAKHCVALRNKIMKSYKKRHQVAHFALVWRDEGAGAQIKVRPFFRHAEFLENSGPAELSRLDIEQKRASFGRLADRVHMHAQHVGELKRLPIEYYARAGDRFHDTRALERDPLALNRGIPSLGGS